VITAETGQGPLGFLFGDKVLLVAYGQVIAGVDLGRLGPEDVLVNGDGTIYLRLPPSEVFVATLDNARTYVYDRQTGVVGLNPQLETAARLEAEQLILQAALEDGLLDQADKNARDFMRSLLAVMGFKHTLFVCGGLAHADAFPIPFAHSHADFCTLRRDGRPPRSYETLARQFFAQYDISCAYEALTGDLGGLD
jgi:hypothetical protein